MSHTDLQRAAYRAPGKLATREPHEVHTADLEPSVTFEFPWHELRLGGEVVGYAESYRNGWNALRILVDEIIEYRAGRSLAA